MDSQVFGPLFGAIIGKFVTKVCKSAEFRVIFPQKLDLGDVSAVWVIREVGKPGDNYMVFDDYKIEQLEADKITPWLGENLAITMKNGVPVITLGPGKCALETSSDLKNWKVLTTSLENKTFTDADFNKKKSQRFYRLRLID